MRRHRSGDCESDEGFGYWQWRLSGATHCAGLGKASTHRPCNGPSQLGDSSWPNAVEIVRADLRAPGDLQLALAGVDAVIHAAAGTSGGEDAQFASSVVATENFLKAMLASQTKRLVLISSFVLYDWDNASSVIDEESPTARSIYELGGYSIAKIWQERIVRAAAEGNALKLTILRPGFIWGEGHAEIAGMGRRSRTRIRDVWAVYAPAFDSCGQLRGLRCRGYRAS